MCDFCDDIKDIEYYKEHNYSYIGSVIIQTGPTSFGLWMKCEGCSNNGGVIKIKFCPMCGADLAKEALLKKECTNNPYYQKYGFDF